MKYGFIIDNRKCIGCHACTVACKSEHDVAIGVNRTWVKQTEKGTFPDSRRVFSVMRCNHCTDAPCVEICPTEALHIRPDGIVDFNNDRCIGCKSCMQACPYDSLYIDPETNTAAKCNYCTHRVDIGLEPACVVVCPEEAIVSGDMDNPDSKISKLLAREQVKVRKPEKNTKPNLFYIDGDEASLNPNATERSEDYIWSSQAGGVGHYAKYAQKKSAGKSYEQMAEQLAGDEQVHIKPAAHIMNSANPKRVYDTPDKGILWGWEVSSYILTKAVSSGIVIMIFALSFLTELSDNLLLVSGIASIVFLGITQVLLVKDLDQPKRFLYVLLRPQWKSWLVRGGYALTIYGGLVSLWVASVYFGWDSISSWILYPTAAFAVLVAIYTAFLFAQAKGRDFWQSPTMAIHMFIHSVMAGAAFLLIYMRFAGMDSAWVDGIFIGALALNMITLFIELATPHPTEDATKAVHMILKGRYKWMFSLGVIAIGNVLPLAFLFTGNSAFMLLAAAVTLIGIYLNNHIWTEAPQRIPLS